MTRITQTPLLLVLMLASCAPITPMLTVRIVSDLTPSTELARTRVTLSVENDVVVDDVNTTFAPMSAVGRGITVATFEQLSRPFRIELTAFDRRGNEVARRVIHRAADGPMQITVLLSRACLGVTCPDACHAGRCVSSACFEESPEACGPAECESLGDCPASAIPCAERLCSQSGACFSVPVSARCEEGLTCDVAVGCRDLRPDGGPVDAGSDASDAETLGDADAGADDASIDDAGADDAGADDAGADDAAIDDAGADDAGMDDAS